MPVSPTACHMLTWKQITGSVLLREDPEQTASCQPWTSAHSSYSKLEMGDCNQNDCSDAQGIGGFAIVMAMIWILVKWFWLGQEFVLLWHFQGKWWIWIWNWNIFIEVENVMFIYVFFFAVDCEDPYKHSFRTPTFRLQWRKSCFGGNSKDFKIFRNECLPIWSFTAFFFWPSVFHWLKDTTTIWVSLERVRMKHQNYLFGETKDLRGVHHVVVCQTTSS